MSVDPPTFASLFSGCGGLDLGFVNSGYKGEIAVDIDSKVLEVHEQNLDALTYQADLSNPATLEGIAGHCDVLIAGSPCQGFSTIGKRRLNDPRNELLLVTARVAEKHKPKLVVAENVPAVTSGKHKKYWKRLHAELRAAGYKTADLRCDSSTMGVPQRRLRMFLIAWRTGKEISFSLPTEKGKNLGDVLEGVDEFENHDPEELVRGTEEFSIAECIEPGQKLSNVRSGPRAVHTWEIPEVFGRTNKAERLALEEIILMRRRNRVRDHGDADPIKSAILNRLFGKELIASLLRKGYLRRINDCYDIASTFNGKFRRLRRDHPSPTVDTRFGDPRCFLHPDENRGFSAREAARIQGFPDDFVFSGSRAEQYRMIGNAVPPPMAAMLAAYLKEALEL